VNKGLYKNFFASKTTHRLAKISTLVVSSCVLLTMINIDASASSVGSRDSIAIRTDVAMARTSKSDNSRYISLVKRWSIVSTISRWSIVSTISRWSTVSTISTITVPTTPVTIVTDTGGGTGTGGGGTPTTTTATVAPTTTTTVAPTTTTTAAPTTPPSSPPSSTTTPPALGVYAGINNQAGVNNFAATTGAHVTLAETYLPWQANTGTSVGWSYLTTQSTLASWLSSWSGTSDQMVIGVPMVALNGSGSPENTLAQGAAGDENANFVTIAKNLVALGFGNAILRPGWEFDGTGYPWTVQSNTDAANFATYWQNIVTAMRSVPGADFKFLWSPTGFQSLSWNISDAYPGNAYVDYVSLDVYDWSWDGTIFLSGDPNNSASVAQSKDVFNEYLTDTEGLNWLASFAQAHDKPIVIPEWAVDSRTDGHGLGDDPTYIDDMYNWFITNHVAWVVYFVDDVADNNNQGIDFLLTDGHFPNSLAAFEADFG
jgi:hypothetical protein